MVSDSYIAGILKESLDILYDIPQFKYVILNLPDYIGCVFSSDIPGIALFNEYNNKVVINPKVVCKYSTPEGKLSFLTLLAHELCHANQKYSGLYFDDLKNSSFGNTFRIARMLELETRLLDAVIENELLKLKEFEKVKPSDTCLFYQDLLVQTKGDVKKAKRNFILSYWTKSIADSREGFFTSAFKQNVKEHYDFYTEQAYHQALLMHKYDRPSNQITEPLQAVKIFLTRMGVPDMDPEWFLQDGVDNIKTTENACDGITLFDEDGSRYCKYLPTENPYKDVITYFTNDIPDKFVLKNGITKKSEDVTIAVKCINKLERAIKARNINIVKDIFAENPDVVNMQSPFDDNFPLLMAVQNNFAEAVDFILAKKPNLFLHTMNGHNIFTDINNLKNKRLRQTIINSGIQATMMKSTNLCLDLKNGEKTHE